MAYPRNTLVAAIAFLVLSITGLTKASAQGGHSRFVGLNSGGQLQTIKESLGWRKSWHQIVPLENFSGSYHTDLLFYDRIRGDAKFYETDGAGSLKLIRHLTGWRKTWDKIIPGHFAGSSPNSSPTDILLYDATSGLARFYEVHPGGTITLLKQYTFQHWDMIIPGNWGGSSHTDLLFYSKSRGEAKFFRTDGTGKITLLKAYRFQKTWDQIVPGLFELSDLNTDLFFYRKVIGDAKFFSVDTSGTLKQLYSYTGLRKTWDVIVPSFLDGISETDLFFYDRTAGKARSAIVTAGKMTTINPLQNMGKNWGRVIAGRHFDSSGGNDFLFYDNTYRLRIHAVRCVNVDGTKAAAITPAQVTQWVDKANEAWASAGIQFEFDPRTDFETIKNDTLNSLDTCKHFSTQRACDVAKGVATFYSAKNPCKITVFFRHGNETKATGGGFSSPSAGYVAMPGFTKTSTTKYYHNANHPDHRKIVQGIKLLAHELGHYLGIAHTFVPVSYKGFTNPHTAVLNYMRQKNKKTLLDMDGDSHVTQDTPPDLGITYFDLMKWNPANILQEIRIKDTAKGIDFTTNPDRHNIMSYMGICNDYFRVTPEQGRTSRDWLQQTHRVKLLDPCSIPGKFISFGQSCKRSQSLSAIGMPNAGQAVAYKLRGAASRTTAVLSIGISKQSWGTLPLPLKLDFIGMTGCHAYNDQLVSMTKTTDSRGEASFRLILPATGPLIGNSLFTQSIVLSPGANPASVTTTNSIETLVGG